jgi:hypothetical protein
MHNQCFYFLVSLVYTKFFHSSGARGSGTGTVLPITNSNTNTHYTALRLLVY